MREVVTSITATGLWIGAIVGAILSLAATEIWGSYLRRRVSSWKHQFRAARNAARGRAPSVYRTAPKASSVLPDYFRQQGNHVDLAIYELSLRPDVPIMDLLYLEYLRGRLEDGSISKVVVVPWSGWRDEDNAEGEARIKRHLKAIFANQFSKVTVVTAAMLQSHAETVFENHFFEEVGNLGNSDFLRNASAVMGYKFRSYHDINQGHPETHQARSIVEHTVRGWLIAKYVEANHLDGSDPPERVGSLMWERELTKLLLLRNILVNYPDIECTLMLGASVNYRRGFQRHPLPTFAEGAITVFGNPNYLRGLLLNKSRSELRRTCQVLNDILAERSALSGLRLWGERHDSQALTEGLHGEALATGNALVRLRGLYGVDDA